MTSSYPPKWSPLQMLFFQINLLSNLNILRLVLGDWSCSGNIKQDFLMILPICCFTIKAVNKWAYISETPPNQPVCPWFSKCALNLGLQRHMLINSADMSHYSPPPLPPSATSLIQVGILQPIILQKDVPQVRFSVYFEINLLSESCFKGHISMKFFYKNIVINHWKKKWNKYLKLNKIS